MHLFILDYSMDIILTFCPFYGVYSPYGDNNHKKIKDELRTHFQCFMTKTFPFKTSAIF